jgi:hypothetical protein
VCCLKEKKLKTCADCEDYPGCKKIRDFYAKNGYKYKKYNESMEYLRKNGYDSFIKTAKKWNGPYGKLE